MKRILGVLLLTLLSTYHCKKAQEQVSSYHGIFTFIKGEVLRNGVAAKTGDKVLAADKIEVKEKSLAILQFAQDAQLTLGAGTVISLDSLGKSEEASKIHLMQQSGTSFSKVLARGSDYRVSTPTLVAGVRGTSFSVTVDPANPRKVVLRLLEGKIQANLVDTPGEAVVLEEGNKIVAEDKLSEPMALSPEEKVSLEKLNQIALADEKTLSEVDKEIEPKAGEFETNIEKLQETIKKDSPKAEATKPQKLTLDDLRKKYGRLSRVTTKDGKEFIGAFQQKGQNIIINTVDGVVTIPVEKVAKISPFQG